MDMVVTAPSTQPASSWHPPLLQYQGQRPSRGREMGHLLENYIIKEVYTVFLTVPQLSQLSRVLV